MNKSVAVVLALVVALVVSGCGGKTIKGSVATVVDEAQELSTDEKAEFEVTGEVTMVSDARNDGTCALFIGDADVFVVAFFDSASIDTAVGNRVTVVGQLADVDGAIQKECVMLSHCKFK